MANTQATFGFKHIGFLPGYAPDFQLTPVAIQSSYATKIGLGDPVTKSSSTSPYIIQATAANATTQPIIGIFQGCYYIPAGGGVPTWSPSWPGASQSQDATGYVINAPGAQFLVATLLTAVTSATLGQAVNFTGGTPATSGFSIATIDQATATSTGTTVSLLPFKIVSLYQSVGNGTDPTTNYNWAVVTFNFQQYKTLAAF